MQMVIDINSYGASEGYPSQHGITKDAQVCFSVTDVLKFHSTYCMSAL